MRNLFRRLTTRHDPELSRVISAADEASHQAECARQASEHTRRKVEALIARRTLLGEALLKE